MTASILRRLSVAALTSVSLASVAAPLAAQAIRNDPGFATNVTPRNDDTQFGFDLPFSVIWDGLTTNHLTINNNGYIGIGSTNQGINACSGGETGGFAAHCGDRVFMAYNRDLDSRNGSTDPLTYGLGTVDGHQAFGANWLNFGFYSFGGPALNFQLVLVDRSDRMAGDFDVEFNYGDMAMNQGGRGGWAGPSGFGAIDGSGTTEFSNRQPGSRAQFTVADGVASGITSVDPTASTVTPEPSTYILMGSGLLGLAGVARRRRRSA